MWVDGRERTWLAHHENGPTLDSNRFVGNVTENRVAYAVCYIFSATEQNDLLLQVGNDDNARVYLNGELVYKAEGHLVTLDPIGPVTLCKGSNVLVFTVVNEASGWAGCLRFVDAEDKPTQGLRVSLTPEN